MGIKYGAGMVICRIIERPWLKLKLSFVSRTDFVFQELRMSWLKLNMA